LLVLRNHRGFPPAPAALIEEVRERVFVLTSVSRQLDHHGLVFFHRELDYEPVSYHYAGARNSGRE
jgi:hypothetical protein